MIEKLEKKLTISDKKSARNGMIFTALLPPVYILFVLLRDFRGMDPALAFNIGVNLMAGIVSVVIYQSCMWYGQKSWHKHRRIFRDKHGMVLGAMPKFKYRDYEIMLEPGSKIFVYTDGVPDACNTAEERYGTKRLEAVLNKTGSESPEMILRNVRADIDGFVSGAKQFDDITMLCLAYKGRNPQEQ